MMKLLFTICLSFLCFFITAQQNLKITADFQDVQLTDALDHLEQKYELHFSYNHTLIEDIKITNTFEKEALKVVLEKLLKETNLEFYFITEKYIILKESKQTTQISATPPRLTLCGSVFDKATNEPLVSASIVVQGTSTGVYSEANGTFQLKGKFPKTAIVEIKYLGYKKQTFLVADLLQTPCKNIYLDYLDYKFESIVIKDYLMEGVDIIQEYNGTEIDLQAISILPGQVEPDVFQMLQVLPGITSANETASGIQIRGGTPDQNLILWDNIPMYSSGHFFGMISGFNPYVVDNIKVFKGGHSPEYGGRVSGVVDLGSSNEIPEKFNLDVGVNLLHGHIKAEIPFWKGKSAMTLATRRAYTNLVQSPTYQKISGRIFQGNHAEDGSFEEDSIIQQVSLGYQDYNLKWLLKPTEKTDLFVSYYLVENEFFVSTEHLNILEEFFDRIDSRNQGISFSGTHQWNQTWKTEGQATYSKFGLDVSHINRDLAKNELVLGQDIRYNAIQDNSYKIINIWEKGAHQVKIGSQFSQLAVSYEVLQEEYLFYSDTLEGETVGKLFSLFGDYNTTIGRKFLFNLGLRYNYYNITNESYFEPRISFNYLPSKAFTIKLNAGIYQQFISQILEFNNIGLGEQIWVLADDNFLEVIQAKQISLGAIYKKEGWLIDADAYYRELNGINSISPLFSGSNPNTTFFGTGTAIIQGLDLLIKKRIKNHETWASLTLSHVAYEFDDINQGNPFPASHDQRVRLSLVHLMKKNNWNFSLAWNFGTGLPYTQPSYIDTYIDNFNVFHELIYEEQNNQRLLPYHRLDFSMVYKFPNTPARWKGTIGLSILNLYNQENLFSREYFIEQFNPNDPFDVGYDFWEREMLRATPNLVVRFRF